MKLNSVIKMIILLAFIGCVQTNQNSKHFSKTDTLDESNIIEPKDETSNQEIYDIMKIVMEELHLDTRFGLTLEPESSCDVSKDDYAFLSKLLIQPEKKEMIPDTNRIRSFTLFELNRCLTIDDINWMLAQKEKHSAFIWDNSRLGFDLSNTNDWYCFSVPLVSKDKKRIVIMIKSLCGGICGTGKTIVFNKDLGKWTAQIGNMWWY